MELKRKLPACLLISFVLSVGAFAQGFLVPPELVSVILVDDPAYPIRLSGPTKVIGYENGGLSFGYTVTSRSNANIKSVGIEATNWFGNHGYGGESDIKPEFVFAPGVSEYSISEEELAQNSFPFDEARAKKIFKNPNRLWIVMVVKAKLSDGTEYNASEVFARMNKFLQDNWDDFSETTETHGTAPSEEYVQRKEREVREFISKLFAQRMPR